MKKMIRIMLLFTIVCGWSSVLSAQVSNEAGSRAEDPGHQGDYDPLCRDGQEQGAYNCP